MHPPSVFLPGRALDSVSEPISWGFPGGYKDCFAADDDDDDDDDDDGDEPVAAGLPVDEGRALLPDVPLKNGRRRWIVITRADYKGFFKDGRSAAVVTIPTNPSRLSLHAHAGIFIDRLEPFELDSIVDDINAVLVHGVSHKHDTILEWLCIITQPQLSPQDSVKCKGCDSHGDLFLDKEKDAYCASCWVLHGVCDVCPTTQFTSPAAVKGHFHGKKHAKHNK